MLDALRKALAFLGRSEVEEPWAQDEQSFEEHFGRSFQEFEERMTYLDRARGELYERTVEVNPEAAIAWVFFVTSDDG